MNRFKHPGIIIIFIVVLVIGAAMIRGASLTGTDDGRSNDELLQAITEEFPHFSFNNTPVIKVESVSRYEHNWYIVTIKSVEQIDRFVPVKVLLHDTDNALGVVLGPDVHFSKYQTLLYDLPDSVIIDLEKK